MLPVFPHWVFHGLLAFVRVFLQIFGERVLAARVVLWVFERSLRQIQMHHVFLSLRSLPPSVDNNREPRNNNSYLKHLTETVRFLGTS